MDRERLLFVQSRLLKVAEGASVATSVGSGVASVLVESPTLAVVGAGTMFLAIGIEILRQRIKRAAQMTARGRKR